MTARLIVAGLLAIGTAHAQTPSETATAHYQRGIKLMSESPKDYAAAARAFADAHAADPDPKYLFNLALAQRLGGNCRAAIENYRAYLATNPPAVNANNAEIGIQRCEQVLAAEPKPPPEPIEPIEPAPVEPEPVVPIETKPTQVTSGRDGVGTTLVVGGGVFVAASVTFYLLARSEAAETHEAGPLPDFETARDQANAFQGISVITGVIGAGLITAGVLRLRKPRTTVTFAPTSSGAAFAIGGRF